MQIISLDKVRVAKLPVHLLVAFNMRLITFLAAELQNFRQIQISKLV